MYIIDKICVVLLLEKLEIIGKNSPKVTILPGWPM
jgi:hypothetical protein